jgi:hypothetical protein
VRTKPHIFSGCKSIVYTLFNGCSNGFNIIPCTFSELQRPYGGNVSIVAIVPQVSYAYPHTAQVLDVQPLPPSSVDDQPVSSHRSILRFQLSECERYDFPLCGEVMDTPSRIGSIPFLLQIPVETYLRSYYAYPGIYACRNVEAQINHLPRDNAPCKLSFLSSFIASTGSMTFPDQGTINMEHPDGVQAGIIYLSALCGIWVAILRASPPLLRYLGRHPPRVKVEIML